MKKGFLKDAFAKSAPAGFFIRNSKWLSSWPFALGCAAMVGKAGFHPDLDTAAGLLLIGSGACFSLQKRYPELSFRLSGALGASAALCMSAKGFDFHTGQVLNAWRMCAPLTGPLIANTIIGFQKEAAAFSQNHINSENRLVRTFAKALRYPLLTAPIIDLTNGANLIKAAVKEHDMMFVGALLVFAIGELGVISSDTRLQEKHRKLNEKPTALPPPSVS
jgi:hypothetical protein